MTGELYESYFNAQAQYENDFRERGKLFVESETKYDVVSIR